MLDWDIMMDNFRPLFHYYLFISFAYFSFPSRGNRGIYNGLWREMMAAKVKITRMGIGSQYGVDSCILTQTI